MPVPSYLREFAADRLEENEKTTVNIADSEGGRLFEIWYYGQPMEVSGYADPLCISTEFSAARFIARSVLTGEDILLFDGAVHGYDNMFCNTYSAEQIENRPMKKMDIPPSEIKIELFYGIDYDEEKDSYEFDENGNCILLNGVSIPWEQVKSDGIDAIALNYKNTKGKWIEFAEEELA